MRKAAWNSWTHCEPEALDLSETRMERVARIRAAINEGTYLPDIAELAQKLMETMCGEFR
jgi:anti-sigma28 factor (negative regulator of flagellin synthesis)